MCTYVFEVIDSEFKVNIIVKQKGNENDQFEEGKIYKIVIFFLIRCNVTKRSIILKLWKLEHYLMEINHKLIKAINFMHIFYIYVYNVIGNKEVVFVKTPSRDIWP